MREKSRKTKNRIESFRFRCPCWRGRLKRSSGETLGRKGSSSRNYDVLGRELMTPDEVRKLDNKKCIVLIRGCDPVMDFKFNTFKHPMFKRSGDGKGKWYVHNPQEKKKLDIMDRKTADRMKQEAGEEGNVIITTINAEELAGLLDKPAGKQGLQEK